MSVHRRCSSKDIAKVGYYYKNMLSDIFNLFHFRHFERIGQTDENF